jgi:two-component system chemotaxis response regulator CheB
MPAPAVAVVGASAGGVEALCAFARSLPADLEHAVLTVLHLAPYSNSVLPQILARNTELPVARAAEAQPLLGGHVYVAPPDRHLVVRERRVHLSTAPSENGHRPAIDAALRTAAGAYGPATVGLVLSGTGDDGTAGLIAVQRAGGATAVQDPEEALYDGMPRAALRHLAVDAVLPVAQMGPWIAQLQPVPAPVRGGATPHPSVPAPSRRGGEALPPGRDPAVEVAEATGAPTRFTCPDCGGVLFASEQPGLLTFNCSVGHKYSPESLMAANLQGVDSALWAAVRVLEDRIVLLSRMADRAGAAGRSKSAASLEGEGRDLLARAATIRELLADPPGQAEAS